MASGAKHELTKAEKELQNREEVVSIEMSVLL
jgi:hypothetical protein